MATLAALTVSSCLITGGEEQVDKSATEKSCSCQASNNDTWQEPAESPRIGGTISMRIESEPGTLLSIFSPHEAIRYIIDHDVLEALVALDTSSGEPVPELATSWNVDESTGTYTFRLDPEARWHDGPPVTAQDVEFTFNLLLDPAGGAVLRNEFLDLEGVEQVDDTTVLFRLDRPKPDFIQQLSRVFILPSHVFGNDVVSTHPASRAPIGSGPFKFLSWKRGRYIEIAANEDWRGSRPNVDRVIYRVVPERRVAIDLFRGRELDIVTNVGPFTRKASKGGRVINHPLSRYEAVVYNTSRPHFTDGTVRRAIGSLLDREAIRCSILGCLAQLVNDPWPVQEQTWNEIPSLIDYDPTDARAALTETGWVDRDADGVREREGVTLSFGLLLPDSDRDLRRAMTVAQWDLARAGIDMRIIPVSKAVYADRLRKHRFDATVISVPNHHPFDPAPYFHSAGIDTGRNFGLYSDETTDRIIEDLGAETSPSARADLAHDLNKRLGEEQPVSFTFRPLTASIVRDTVRGVSLRDEWFDERALWIDPSPRASE